MTPWRILLVTQRRRLGNYDVPGPGNPYMPHMLTREDLIRTRALRSRIRTLSTRARSRAGCLNPEQQLMDATSKRRRRVALGAIFVVFAVVIAGCTTGNNGGKEATSERFTHPRASDEVVIEVSSGGGLAPAAVRVSDTVPRIWISGDGRHLQQVAKGADTPALLTLEERRIPEAAVQRLLGDASDAGLLADSPDYGTPKIFDAVNTRVLVVAEGRRHDVLVRALGYPVADLDAATVAARRRVSRFIDVLEHPERITGIDSPHPYTPTEVAVFVLGPAAASDTTAPATWPLGDLAMVGSPAAWPAPSARCLVVAGADLQAVDAAAAGITRFAPWGSGDTVWDVAMRPLLPDEHTCADVIG